MGNKGESEIRRRIKSRVRGQVEPKKEKIDQMKVSKVNRIMSYDDQ